MLHDSEPGKDMTTLYPWTTKTRKTGFAFKIPARFQNLFKLYMTQLDDSVQDTERFLKNTNVKSKKRYQNLREKKISQFPKLWGQLLGYSEDFIAGLSSHTFRRTAATLLADSSIDMINLKQIGRWASKKCVEGYIDESKTLKNLRLQHLDTTISGTKKSCSDNPKHKGNDSSSRRSNNDTSADDSSTSYTA